jgi:two-component system chemotaxis response regulator CheB
MPAGYTDAFARRLDKDCAVEVVEAREGLMLRAGLVIIARAGIHLTIEKAPQGGWRANLDVRPIGTLHRPSVDVLFTSAAKEFGAGTLGVVLTGMGSDGLEGSRAVHAAGGRLLTETEESCVVYGMPRVVFEANLAVAEAPIAGMASLVMSSL